MKQQFLLSGEEAIAWGSIHAGVKIVTAYPGSPGLNTVNCLAENAARHQLNVTWCTNEKVACEVAIGASIAGKRALVCVKNVGLNAMLDPLMTLNLTPLNSGLVFLIGDDPGAYGSQNDQDSRPLAHLLEMPWLEPSSPKTGYQLTLDCFRLSEKYRIPFFIRITRAYASMEEKLVLKNPPQIRESRVQPAMHDQFIPHPANAVNKHLGLQMTLNKLKSEVSISNHRSTGNGRGGIIASGFSYQKLQDVLMNEDQDIITVLDLVIIYPIDEKLILRFIQNKKHILILEEHHPVVENQVRVITQMAGYNIRIYGKIDKCIPSYGELFRWQIKAALSRLFPEVMTGDEFTRENEINERPGVISHCKNSRYGEVLDLLDNACQDSDVEPFYIGDPGCLVTVADRIHAKYAMGSAVGVAMGFRKSGSKRFPIAVFGDSSFFHSTIPAICNAAQFGSDLLLILLDNGSALTTGAQPHPASTGNKAPLSMVEVAKKSGVTSTFEIILGQDNQGNVIREALSHKGLRLVNVVIR